jgi:hypothetical protein
MFNHAKQHVLILKIVFYISLFSSFGEACWLFTMQILHYNHLCGFHQNFDRLYNKQFHFIVLHNIHSKTCLNFSHLKIINWVPTFNCECLNMILVKCFFCLNKNYSMYLDRNNKIQLFVEIHLAFPCPFHIS